MSPVVPSEEFPPQSAAGKGLFPMPQAGFALVIEDMKNPLVNLDGAIVELRVCGPGMLGAIVRIEGKDPHEAGYQQNPVTVP